MIEDILERFPKVRNPLLPEYEAVYEKHYSENRKALTNASRVTKMMEAWRYKKVAYMAKKVGGGVTLKIGAGTLNQLDYEDANGVYDIVEPKHKLFEDSVHIKRVNTIYDDIKDIPLEKKYDRITSLYTFEHIANLPEVISLAGGHLDIDGMLIVIIPNEGRFLWRFAYNNTTGREFKRRYGLDYEVIMQYVHVNTADEIEALLRYYFKDVKEQLFGITKSFAFYRYYECKQPIGRWI